MFIIVFLLILSLLVLVHEFGHFIVAKKNGVLVEEFGLGLPPRIFGKKIGETIYSLNLLPFGGFVKVYGEEYYEEDSKLDTKLRKRAFVYKKPWQKILILTAGVIGNFILGWVLISYLFTQGIPTPTNKVIIEQVQKNSPAFQAGIKEQDIITGIIKNSKTYPIKTNTDLINLTQKFAGQKIQIQIKRGNQVVKVTISPRKNPPKNQGSLGVTISSYMVKKYPWYQAPFYGLIEASNITSKIVSELFNILKQLVTFQKVNIDVTGPIGIAKFTDQAIKFGKDAVLELIALLSLNLAVVNILPFPALDGGRLVFVLYEVITRKRPNKEFEKKLNLFGLIILLSLVVLISIRDIMKFYK